MLIPTINIIKCKKERYTKVFAYTSFMFNKSSTTKSIGVFEDLNVTQIGIKKDDHYCDNWLTIWWDDLKIQVQMLGM